MPDTADRAYIYGQHTIPFPACSGPLELTIPVWLFALLDEAGITDAEVLERLEAHLLQRLIVCEACKQKPGGQG